VSMSATKTKRTIYKQRVLNVNGEYVSHTFPQQVVIIGMQGGYDLESHCLYFDVWYEKD